MIDTDELGGLGVGLVVIAIIGGLAVIALVYVSHLGGSLGRYASERVNGRLLKYLTGLGVYSLTMAVPIALVSLLIGGLEPKTVLTLVGLAILGSMATGGVRSFADWVQEVIDETSPTTVEEICPPKDTPHW